MCWPLLLLTFAIVINSEDAPLDRPPIGGAINLLDRYGLLDYNVKATRIYHIQELMFSESTVKVFKNVSQVQPTEEFNIGRSEWRLYFCKSTEELLKNYFKNFRFEGVEKPWNVFTTSWDPNRMANVFGINSSFIRDGYFYVILSYSRYFDGQTLTGIPENLDWDETIVSEANNMIVGNVSSFIRFSKKVGTHYIHSFVTGDSLYQVFVYERLVYQQFENFFGGADKTNISLVQLNEWLSARTARHIGRISAVSGIDTIEVWANVNMKVKTDVPYKSLLTAARSKTILSHLDGLLREKAVLGVELRTLAPLFKDPNRRKFFEELILNDLRLYEVNV